MSEEARPRVKAALELAGERCELEVGDGRLLSEKLVELKALCMERLSLFLLRHNATAGEDALSQEPSDASDGEEDDSAALLADDDNSSNPPRPKKRK